MQPKIIVAMGADALTTLGEIEIPLARELEPRLGEIQQLTPSIDALYVPNLDESLDEQDAKREFWSAFRVLGELVPGAAALLTARGRTRPAAAPRLRP